MVKDSSAKIKFNKNFKTEVWFMRTNAFSLTPTLNFYFWNIKLNDQLNFTEIFIIFIKQLRSIMAFRL